MDNLKELKWANLIRVSSEELNKWIILSKESPISDRINVRFYQLKSNDDNIDEEGFINYLLTTIQHYVFDKEEIDELLEDGQDPFTEALRFFGDIDPMSDGRYGELLLYLLTEGILKVPLIVHKISNSYSSNKQTEGSDGVFIGILNEKLSLLLGESKMKNKYSLCLSEAISSIDRFHSNTDAFEQEVKIARKHLSKDLNNLTPEALTSLHKSFRIKASNFSQFNLSHPILLVYKEKDLVGITDDIENKVRSLILSKSEKRENSINSSSSNIPKHVTLNFFLLPVKTVNDFRKAMYKTFHGGNDYVKKDS